MNAEMLLKNYAKENYQKMFREPMGQHIAFIVEQNDGDITWIKEDFPIVLSYIDYYMKNCRHENGICFGIDDCAIGVDNDPCTFKKRDTGQLLR